MEIFQLFGIAGLIIFIGFVGEIIFRRTNIPDVIWLMLVGIILNFFTENIIADTAFTAVAPIFTTFALIFILFEGALNINITQFLKGFLGGVILTLNSFILSSLSIGLIMFIFFKWDFLPSLLLGTIIGGSSSAIVIPIVKRLKISTKTNLILTIESAISDVLCIVASITIVNIITLNTLQVESVFQEILYSFIVAAALGVIGGLLWIRVQDIMRHFSKSYMTTIAFLLALYSFVEFVNSNGAIACLFFGLILGNSKKIILLIKKKSQSIVSPSGKFFYSQISFFVKSFFFVYLGLIIDFSDYGSLIIGFLLTLILFYIRPVAVLLSTKKSMQKKERVFMEILAPKGLAAAVLAQLPSQSGMFNGEQYSTIVSSVIFFSIILSTILVFLTERGLFKGIRIPNIKIKRELKEIRTIKQDIDEYIEKRKAK
ncbi:cation:proton antiporter [Candidatus Woesearchaeota archaeon]|nr:cation:proton antiporter [Candidatus Woesearchaeota archaeon]